MISNYSVTLFTILALLFQLTNCLGQQGKVNDVIAIHNVNLLPMDSAYVLKGQTLIIKNGTIAELGLTENIIIPEDAEVINGNGHYLLPGLTDFHIHLRSPDELISYLFHGVTAVVHTSGAMNGAPDLLRYKKQLAIGLMTGPQLYLTGPILDGDPPIFAGVSVSITSPGEASRIVAEQKREGYDFIKVYNNLTPDLLNAITREAQNQNMAVIGHIPRKAGRDQALQHALDAGMDMIAHGEEYFFTYFYARVDSLLGIGEIPHPDENRISSAVRISREAGVYVTPNLSFVAMTRKQLDSLENVFSDPETRYLHPDVLEMWREQNATKRDGLEEFDKREQAKYVFLKKFTGALQEAGVPLLLGTDASAPGLFPGKSAHSELYELVMAGLTPFEALTAGTRNAGVFIGQNVLNTEPFGVIKAGQKANLILVEGNPLEDIRKISNIRGVMTEGRWYTRENLHEMRNKIPPGNAMQEVGVDG
jgi:hypothetical protein